MLHFEVELEVAYELSSRLHYITLFVIGSEKRYIFRVIMIFQYKYQCVTAFVALYVCMYVKYFLKYNNGPGVYYL